jgi:hypothetical protein
MGRNRSCLLRTPDGVVFAGALGYLTDGAFNLHMLTRRDGVLDKYSPGFYLTFWLIRNMLTQDRPVLFLFGPGEFQYKKTFLARELPIYRYERRCLPNVFGVLRLYNRLRKERQRQEQSDAPDGLTLKS